MFDMKDFTIKEGILNRKIFLRTMSSEQQTVRWFNFFRIITNGIIV